MYLFVDSSVLDEIKTQGSYYEYVLRNVQVQIKGLPFPHRNHY